MVQRAHPPPNTRFACYCCSVDDRSTVQPLRELIALMVHDLSNPLQSLSMLLELAQDDVAPGSEPHERLIEASRAAVTMRRLVRGLGDFNRSARLGQEVPAARLVSSTLGVLERRFERQGMQLINQVEGLDEADVVGEFQLVLLTLLLAGLSAESDPGKKLVLTVSVPVPDCLRVGLAAGDSAAPDQPAQPWPLSAGHVQHAQRLASELDLRFDAATTDQAKVWIR